MSALNTTIPLGAPTSQESGNSLGGLLSQVVGGFFDTAKAVAPSYFQAQAAEAIAGRSAMPTSIGHGARSSFGLPISDGMLFLIGGGVLLIVLLRR